MCYCTSQGGQIEAIAHHRLGKHIEKVRVGKQGAGNCFLGSTNVNSVERSWKWWLTTYMEAFNLKICSTDGQTNKWTRRVGSVTN